MTSQRYPDPYPFLRVPPFPGGSSAQAVGTGAAQSAASVPIEELIALLRSTQVGGTYWAAHPALPDREYLLLRPKNRDQAIEFIDSTELSKENKILLWLPKNVRFEKTDSRLAIYQGEADPWHMLSGASALWTDGGDETAFIAALLDVEVRLFGSSTRFDCLTGDRQQAIKQIAARELLEHDWIDPFTGMPCPVGRMIGYSAEWRRLVDANRSIKAAFGFGHWKQDTVDALLWNGTDPHTYFATATPQSLDSLPDQSSIAIWKAKVPEAFLAICESSAHALYEVEDGFIRSVGLGADCVPPLSIIVDPVGVHYDPSGPSSLEIMLAKGNFPTDLLKRARQLRELIIESRISKYDAADKETLPRPGGPERRHILVLGQVEDDRSILAGGGDVCGNLDLLRRARALEPEAYLLYKPHPDVVAGHRVGHVAEADALQFADRIIGKESISALLDMVDGVHVITSLAGFEALLRGKTVTTHGTPFYAGWGLTTDMGIPPERRQRICTLDELVAATLLQYPRYLDPVTGLPCPPEILIERLRGGARRKNTILVLLRRAQGNLRRLISGLWFRS